MTRRHVARMLAAVALAVLAAPWPALAAQEGGEAPGALTGTLARAGRTHVVRIGYRTDAAPFSFVSRAGIPAGYTLDLCRAVVEAMRHATGGRPLRIDFVRVDAADRIDRVAAGDVDLECGSTSVTAARAARVAFSPAIFVTGTTLAVATGSRVRSIGDLRGKRVAVVRGTTNEEVVRGLAQRRGLGLEVVAVADLAEALALAEAGGVAAVAGDDVLIVGELARSGRRRSFAVVGGLLSFDRYAIAFARDDAPLAALVESTLRELFVSGELRRTYDKWFVRTLPNGVRLGLPMSTELERSFDLLGGRPPG